MRLELENSAMGTKRPTEENAYIYCSLRFKIIRTDLSKTRLPCSAARLPRAIEPLLTTSKLFYLGPNARYLSLKHIDDNTPPSVMIFG
jgi:hypothetical protein